jgi:hypothetical protein
MRMYEGRTVPSAAIIRSPFPCRIRNDRICAVDFFKVKN